MVQYLEKFSNEHFIVEKNTKKSQKSGVLNGTTNFIVENNAREEIYEKVCFKIDNYEIFRCSTITNSKNRNKTSNFDTFSEKRVLTYFSNMQKIIFVQGLLKKHFSHFPINFIIINIHSTIFL